MTTILRKVRKERGLTIPYMAKKLGIPEGYYSEIETGKKTVSDERAQAIADVISVDKNEIFLPSRFAVREEGQDQPVRDRSAGPVQALTRGTRNRPQIRTRGKE